MMFLFLLSSPTLSSLILLSKLCTWMQRASEKPCLNDVSEVGTWRRTAVTIAIILVVLTLLPLWDELAEELGIGLVTSFWGNCNSNFWLKSISHANEVVFFFFFLLTQFISCNANLSPFDLYISFFAICIHFHKPKI